MTEEPLLLPLEAIDPDADRRFGGKACGLARLLRAGAAVPPGFAVAATTEPPGRWPRELRNAFVAACDRLLASGPIAVRSSATTEDGASWSFAGLFVTTLDLRSADDALEAGTRTVASGAAARPAGYGDGQAGPLPVGVVVQHMAAARAAGTLFTVDPQGRDGAVLIEAVAGRGEALVGGTEDPERWRVYLTGHGQWDSRLEHPAASWPGGVLTAAEAGDLAAEAARLATALGRPLDLEWALAATASGARIQWLQARPITAAVPPPSWRIERSVADADDGPITVWSSWNVRETMPEPLHPLSWSLWREIVLPFVTERFFGVPRSSPIFDDAMSLDRIQGRVYFNLNAALAIPAIGGLLRPVLRHIDTEAGEGVADLMSRGVLVPRRLRGARGSAFATLRTLASVARAGPAALRALRPGACLAALEAAAARVASRPEIETLEIEGLLAELRLWESEQAGELRDGLQHLTVALLAWVAADHLFAPWPEARRRLVAGIRGNPTTEISAWLDRLVERARPLRAAFVEPEPARARLERLAASAEGREWLEGFAQLLRFCGQRGPREFDFAAPRWSEDPTLLVELVRQGLLDPEREPVDARLDRLARERHAAIAAAIGAAPRWRRPLLRLAATTAARLMPLREAPKHYGLVVFQRMRLAAIELGRRLTAAGALAEAADVFYLELAELEAAARDLAARIAEDSDPRPAGEGGAATPDGGSAGSLAERIDRRRRELEDFHRRPAPDFLRSDGVPVATVASAQATDDRVLRGAGVSMGTASGLARVLTEPDPAAFALGEVLVVRFADPGWTPLFPRAAALVMEVGGVMCHAAVVARELGIPAVFGVAGATARLAGGGRVAVDGASGEVRLLDPPGVE